MKEKRLTLFAGHYGSGKTNIAVNYALSLAKEGKKVCIADLDIVNPYFRTKDSEAELAEKAIALKERELDAEIRKQADAMKYQMEKKAEAELIKQQREAEAEKYRTIQAAEAKKAEAEALRYAMEQEAAGIRAKGLAEAEAIEKKAEAQKKMGEASVLEMYLTALPEVVKNAAAPLSQTDRIVMYGDGNSTKLVKDVMNSANQIMEGVKESTGLDLTALLSGVAGGKIVAAQNKEENADQ
jgi:flotillin